MVSVLLTTQMLDKPSLITLPLVASLTTRRPSGHSTKIFCLVKPFRTTTFVEPPKLTRKLKFKAIAGMHDYSKFQAYDVAAEFPEWHPSSDDPVAKKDKGTSSPDQLTAPTEVDSQNMSYFNGDDDEITSMLADIYAGDLMRSKCVAGPATTPSGELSNATSTSITPSDSAATNVTSHYNAAPALASEEDMYDCGWCDPVAADIEENPHDCGWGDGPPRHTSTKAGSFHGKPA
ncbi:hypothetical protein C8R48DRAFT_771684 [Suillus tomentosus]|nr:hypothetical protein C8R48DRAFT_771684 [Suillus tomentosus]